MSADGIDEKTGMINVYIACPKAGDSIMVTNLGDRFEIHHRSHQAPELLLTDNEIERLKQGIIVWH
jgi:hypothetical protein